VLGTEPFEAAINKTGIRDLYWGEILIYNIVAAMFLVFIIFFMR